MLPCLVKSLFETASKYTLLSRGRDTLRQYIDYIATLIMTYSTFLRSPPELDTYKIVFKNRQEKYVRCKQEYLMTLFGTGNLKDRVLTLNQEEAYPTELSGSLVMSTWGFPGILDVVRSPLRKYVCTHIKDGVDAETIQEAFDLPHTPYLDEGYCSYLSPCDYIDQLGLDYQVHVYDDNFKTDDDEFESRYLVGSVLEDGSGIVKQESKQGGLLNLEVDAKNLDILPKLRVAKFADRDNDLFKTSDSSDALTPPMNITEQITRRAVTPAFTHFLGVTERDFTNKAFLKNPTLMQSPKQQVYAMFGDAKDITVDELKAELAEWKEYIKNVSYGPKYEFKGESATFLTNATFQKNTQKFQERYKNHKLGPFPDLNLLVRNDAAIVAKDAIKAGAISIPGSVFTDDAQSIVFANLIERYHTLVNRVSNVDVRPILTNGILQFIEHSKPYVGLPRNIPYYPTHMKQAFPTQDTASTDTEFFDAYSELRARIGTL